MKTKKVDVMGTKPTNSNIPLIVTNYDIKRIQTKIIYDHKVNVLRVEVKLKKKAVKEE